MKKDTLLLFIILLGFGQITATCMTPALSSIAVGLSTDIHLVESALGVFFAGFALGVSFWGIMADWYGRRIAELSGLFVYIIAALFCTTTSTILGFWSATFIQAFGIAAASVVTQTSLRDLCTEKNRAHVFSLISIAIAFSPAIGPLIGTWLNTVFGWQSIFLALFAIGALLFAWCIFTFPETRKKDAKPQTISGLATLCGTMLRDPMILSCSLLIGICNASLFAFFAEAPFIFINHMHIEEAYYAWIGTCVSCAVLVAGVMSRRLLKKMTSEGVIYRGTFAMALGATLFACSALSVYNMQLTGIGPTALFIACLFILFLGMGLVVPNVLSIALKAYHGHVGSAGSIFGCAYYCVLSLLTVTVSMIHNGSILPLPLFLVAITLTAVMTARKLVPQPQPV